MKNDLGFSVIELIISSFIGIIIVSTSFSVYLHIKRNTILQDELLYMAETGRYATVILSRAIRNAGDFSCVNEEKKAETLPIQGHYKTKPSFLESTKVISDDVLIATTCKQELNYNKLASTAYYVADTGRKNKHGSKIYGLYQKIEDGQSQEILNHVNDVVFFYGIIPNEASESISYYRADQINEWSLVCSVKIVLSLTSNIPVLEKSVSYQTYMGKAYNDRYLHRDWIFDVVLRN